MEGNTEVQTGPAVETPAPTATAASGRGKTGVILAVVVVVVVVISALAYVFVLDGDMTGNNEKLTGKWEFNGAQVHQVITANNDTTNAVNTSSPITPCYEVVEFVDGVASLDAVFEERMNMTIEDLGNGRFRITDFCWGEADFGTVEGEYVDRGESITFELEDITASYTTSTDGYLEIEMDLKFYLVAYP